MFKIGQVYTSPAEPELGLGTVFEIGDRTVTLDFFGRKEQRCYETFDAPIQRFQLSEGQQIKLHNEKSYLVQEVKNQGGLMAYLTEEGWIHEAQCHPFMEQGGPEQRFINGQFDPPHWFEARHEALMALSHAKASPYQGLQGGRIQLYPHQLYCAQKLTERHRVRVMLADEVGLGKTIEAALIAHRLHLAGRIARILIVVPDALTFQWFAELYLRFHFEFKILDEAALEGIEDEEQGLLAHPFLICPLSMYDSVELLDEAWDMLIVDEVHHILPNSDEGQWMSEACQQIQHILLLSATPTRPDDREHYERLRWIDADRFADYHSYLHELKNTKEIAELHQKLIEQQTLSQEDRQRLAQWLCDPEIASNNIGPEEAQSLSHRLMDLHGPGYHLIKNTRRQVGGFPQRNLHLHWIDDDPKRLKKEYLKELEIAQSPELDHESESQTESSGDEMKSAEALEDSPTVKGISYRYNFKSEQRLVWLKSFLDAMNPDEKALIMCANRLKVNALADALESLSKQRSARFHENMSLMERDRQSAWFHEEDGPNHLISSSIGAEGRNFQIAQHLIFMDLPHHPAELEQRIGRLDRIGQRSDIHLHLPLCENTPQHQLYRWHHEVYQAFTQPWCGLDKTFTDHREQLMESLSSPTKNLRDSLSSSKHLDDIIHSAKTAQTQLETELEQGRDLLLEHCSCNPEEARKLAEHIESEDNDRSLEHLMVQTWDHWGVDARKVKHRTYRLKPNDFYELPFPGFKEKGMTVTFDRSISLERDDATFVSWDHPMVTNALELITQRALGQCSALQLNAPQGLIIESLFVVTHSCPQQLNADRFLPPSPLRIAVHHSGKAVKIKAEKLKDKAKPAATPEIGEDLKRLVQDRICDLQGLAEERSQSLIEDAQEKFKDHAKKTLSRLLELKHINPAILDSDVIALKKQHHHTLKGLSQPQLRLDAIRLIFCQN